MSLTLASHKVILIIELLCSIIDYLSPSDATLFYISLNNKIYNIKNNKTKCITSSNFMFTLPDIQIYWKKKVEHALSKHKNHEDIYFRLGYYINKPMDYMDIFRRIYINTKCCRSGCYQWFYECDNTYCYYHPGNKKVNSRGSNSKLTCCDAKDFNEKGCKMSISHDGTFYNLTNLPRI